MERHCLKCGHLNPNAEGDDLEACPACGAIYSRVAAVWNGKQTQVRTEAFNRTASKGDFLDQLRDETAYPVYRWWEKLYYRITLIVAVLTFLAGMFRLFQDSVGLGFGMCVLALLLAVAARFIHEAAQMFADMSDAAVRTAYNTQPKAE